MGLQGPLCPDQTELAKTFHALSTCGHWEADWFRNEYVSYFQSVAKVHLLLFWNSFRILILEERQKYRYISCEAQTKAFPFRSSYLFWNRLDFCKCLAFGFSCATVFWKSRQLCWFEISVSFLEVYLLEQQYVLFWCILQYSFLQKAHMSFLGQT